MRIPFALVAAALVAMAGSAPVRRAGNDLKPPTGYRTWFHVNSALIDSASSLFGLLGGLHNVHINSVGQPALQSGALYPAGTVFVDDIQSFTVSDHVYTQTGRTALAVMVRDPKEYPATGGWGFQVWAGGDSTKPLVKNATMQCFRCHESRKDHQYVFSTYIP